MPKQPEETLFLSLKGLSLNLVNNEGFKILFHNRRFIANPEEAAFIRRHDRFKRGLIQEVRPAPVHTDKELAALEALAALRKSKASREDLVAKAKNLAEEFECEPPAPRSTIPELQVFIVATEHGVDAGVVMGA